MKPIRAILIDPRGPVQGRQQQPVALCGVVLGGSQRESCLSRTPCEVAREVGDASEQLGLGWQPLGAGTVGQGEA